MDPARAARDMARNPIAPNHSEFRRNLRLDLMLRLLSIFAVFHTKQVLKKSGSDTLTARRCNRAYIDLYGMKGRY